MEKKRRVRTSKVLLVATRSMSCFCLRVRSFGSVSDIDWYSELVCDPPGSCVVSRVAEIKMNAEGNF